MNAQQLKVQRQKVLVEVLEKARGKGQLLEDVLTRFRYAYGLSVKTVKQMYNDAVLVGAVQLKVNDGFIE